MFDPRYKDLEKERDQIQETLEGRTVHYQETESFYYNELGEKIRKLEIMETRLEVIKGDLEDLEDEKKYLLLTREELDSVINLQARVIDANIEELKPIKINKL